jgi:hypothetical protein
VKHGAFYNNNNNNNNNKKEQATFTGRTFIPSICDTFHKVMTTGFWDHNRLTSRNIEPSLMLSYPSQSS